MNIKLKRSTTAILKLAGLAVAAVIGILVFYKLCVYLAPFVIAFCLSTFMEPVIGFLMKRLKLSRRLAAPITLLFMLLALGGLLGLLISKLITEIISISRTLPSFFSELYISTNVLLSKAAQHFEWLPSDFSADVGSLIANLSSSLTKIVDTLVKGAYTTAISIPEAMIFIIATILSTYFLASDREKIYGFFKRQLPVLWIEKLRSLKDDMFSALFGYLKAQAILMSITFTELFIGFSIINIKYALLLAVLVSLIDALPILGTGTVLIPWGIYSLLTGNIRMGVSTLVLYVIVLIVRQMVEPKVLGHQIGVYPLLTLISMYVGLQYFGFAGLILGPVTLLLLKNMFSGIFKKRTLKDMISLQERESAHGKKL